MADIVQFKPLAEQPSLTAVCAAYPRQEGVYWLQKAYVAGMVPIPLSELLIAFQRYAQHVKRMNIEWQYIKTVQKYVELHCWEDRYPEAPITNYDGEALKAARRECQARGQIFDLQAWLQKQPPRRAD